MGPKYQVAISSDQKAVFGTFDISKITVHPKYDTTTQANNLAIVYFDASSKGKFTNAIADWPAEWKSHYFVRQTQTNATKPIWNSPLVAVTDATADPGNCAKLSSLYSNNQADLICTQVTAPTYAVKGCVAPFGSMYGVSSSNLALGALFSHSATSGGEGLCSKGQVYSYYTILRNYLAWVSKEVGGQVPVLHGTDSKYAAQTNAEYAMGMTQASNTITSSATTTSTTTTSTTTSTSISRTNSASSNQPAAVAALVTSLITATLTQSATTVTITAPVSTLISTVTTTSVSISVLTVTPVPSIIYITLPPTIQTVVSTVTSTVTNVVTSAIALAEAESTLSATPISPPQPSINPSSSGSKMSSAAIAALVIGLLLLTALLAFLYIRRKRKQRQNGHAYSEQYDSGLSRVRKWLFDRGNGPPRGSSPALIPHDAHHY
ncbi:hypothetical protein GGI17_005204 [Coemansia sp. S146]|nr:hypothetical protein GGI17_005204 [Coemansia sp. S146]